jgi:hypothetical protein
VRFSFKALAVVSLLLAAAVWADPTQYTLESANGKTFTVRDHLGRSHAFKGKRPCPGVRSGHKVVFERGGPNVTCISAQLRDLVTNATCSVWCVNPSAVKLTPPPKGSATDARTRDDRKTDLLDLTAPDAGTPSRRDRAPRRSLP